MSGISDSSERNVRETPNQYRGVHYLVLALGLITILLLIAGGLVTSNVAGDSVPDWPLSLGRWVLFGTRGFVGNVRYEYSHRAIAGAVTFVTAAVALWTWLKPELRKRFGKLSLAAFGGVLLQAGLGGIRVLFPEYKIPIAIVHAFVAQGFFCLVVALWVVTSSSWNFPRPVIGESNGTPLRRLSTLTVAAILIQLILGAGFRHDALGIGWHIGGAVVVTLLVTWTAYSIFRRHKAEAYLKKPAVIVCVFLVSQIGLGIAAYLARLRSVNDPQPLEPMVSLTVAHVVVGALTLASALVLAMRCYKILAPRVSESPQTAASQYSGGIGSRQTGRA